MSNFSFLRDEFSILYKESYKSKSNSINAIKSKIDIINKILNDGYNLSNINDLESIRVELEGIADLSLDSTGRKPIITNFADEIVRQEDVQTQDFIDMGSIKTEFQEVVDEYINNLEHLKTMEDSPLITQSDIETVKQYLYSSQEILEDRLKDNNDFESVIKDIINSSNKEVANKILDNFINKTTHSEKQIEIMTKIKNIVFDKTYLNIKTSVVNIGDILFGDNHPLGDKFANLSEDKQDELIKTIEAIKLLEEVDEVSN